MTDLSIIIVSYKGWARLTKCLEALNAFTGKSLSAGVIVVDNRSDDDVIFQLENKFPKFKFIHNSINGGFSNGCNLGAKNAPGTFLLFLNPDTIVSEPEIEKLVEVLREHENFGIVSCRQITENGKESVATGVFPGLFNLTGFQRAIFKSHKPRPSDLTPDITYPDWISGSVILIRKETFQKIHGFDEDFWMYYEDVDICRRIRNLSGEIAFCRAITIEHNHGGSSRVNLKTTSLTKTEVHISRHVYIDKHKSGPEKYIIQSFLVINNIITGGIMALLGMVFFFVPKLFVRSVIYYRLIRYYIRSSFTRSWISPRSVNYH